MGNSKGYSDKDNPFRLSKEELQVLRLWQKGESMDKSYRIVMKPAPETKEATVKQRIKRFFGTYRMREAMAATPGIRGAKAKAEFEKWKISSSTEAIRQIRDTEVFRTAEERKRIFSDEQLEEIKKKDDKTLWLESLNISQTPASLTVYGTGQFLAYVAVKEIMDRQKAIKENKISPLDKNGSALTPTIISALKTAAAMILPFAPAPSAEDRKAITKASILLGLFPDDITEDPDQFTAPPPATVDVEGGGENKEK